MKLTDMFPRKYANGTDLVGPTTVTISKLVQEQVHPRPNAEPEAKWILYAKDLPRGFILTRALATGIADALGQETDLWVGKRITLIPVPMVVAHREVVAIRARKAEPVQAQQPPAAPQKPAQTHRQLATARNEDDDAADAYTGEIAGKVALHYANGLALSSGLAEQQAFETYCKAERKAPQNVEQLRAWVKATPDKK
jgi:hypothetical protein